MDTSRTRMNPQNPLPFNHQRKLVKFSFEIELTCSWFSTYMCFKCSKRSCPLSFKYSKRSCPLFRYSSHIKRNDHIFQNRISFSKDQKWAFWNFEIIGQFVTTLRYKRKNALPRGDMFKVAVWKWDSWKSFWTFSGLKFSCVASMLESEAYKLLANALAHYASTFAQHVESFEKTIQSHTFF